MFLEGVGVCKKKKKKKRLAPFTMKNDDLDRMSALYTLWSVVKRLGELCYVSEE